MVDPEGLLEAVLRAGGAAHHLQPRVAHHRPKRRRVVAAGELLGERPHGGEGGEIQPPRFDVRVPGLLCDPQRRPLAPFGVADREHDAPAPIRAGDRLRALVAQTPVSARDDDRLPARRVNHRFFLLPAAAAASHIDAGNLTKLG